MSEELIVTHCAPTLANMKVGNLFNCSYDCIELLYTNLTRYNRMLNSKGVYLVLLKLKNNRALIYVFRPNKLKTSLESIEVQNFLSRCGYKDFSLFGCLNTLKQRICIDEDFPHEIGIFLGYPIEDVTLFISNKGQNFKSLGHWKVYSNEAEALMTFKRFNQCTRIYKQKLKDGFSFERLVV